jgi:ribosome assembly protein YihI (activator of Der GTPase)
MTKALKDEKLEAHLDAIENHKALLEKLHLNANEHLDEVSNSLEQLTLTLEEYLKLIGIP